MYEICRQLHRVDIAGVGRVLIDSVMGVEGDSGEEKRKKKKKVQRDQTKKKG